MNHVVSLSVALALASALVSPAEAAKKKAPQKPNAPAVAAHRAPAPHSAGRVAFHQQPQHRAGPAKKNIAAQHSAVTRNKIASQHALQQRHIASQRSFTNQQRIARAQAQRNRPLPIAERRSVVSNRSSVVVNNRTVNYNVRPPYTVYRGWDHGRVHWWNDHPYHWSSGTWVVWNDYTPYASATLSYAPGGYSGSVAGNVQAVLARDGYDPGPADGVIGPQTRDAIAAYQQDHGLAVTGGINNSLLRSLGL